MSHMYDFDYKTSLEKQEQGFDECHICQCKEDTNRMHVTRAGDLICLNCLTLEEKLWLERLKGVENE